MRRMATTLALSAWMGFTSLSALRLAHDAGLLVGLADNAGLGDLPALILPALDLGLLPHESLAFAAMLAALAIGFGMGIAGLNASSSAAVRRSEPLAGAVLVALLALYAAAAMTGSPVVEVFGGGPGFLFSAAMTFGALLFDHLMEVDDEGADDEAFEAVLNAIRTAERQALLKSRQSNSDEGDSR